ncbi:adenosylcobalamin-dependent ribonucleoside-diphosphate reductase [Anoxybacteroides tepidamans]|uniref:adenosylcobalamin-dependent ribonucleoside-diphosphate reductase n=1 Tax=Anoxybacteroides tepidamans TaxID=265948 RepID=UPI000483945B|nr:adenosylcobalamin-dependent ribonucleoside-diphosphate reductase [Anoxybacillus tepidamans]
MLTTTKRNQLFLQFSDENVLSEIGERILADRYLLKVNTRTAIKKGSIVIAKINDKNNTVYDLARVVSLLENSKKVRIQLRDGHETDVPIENVSILKETSPEEMWRRISKEAAKATDNPNLWEGEFFKLLENWKYVPGGRIIASLGTGYKTTSYNCFVVPNVGPTPTDYAEALSQVLEILAFSGGVGMNLSQVPPQGRLVPITKIDKQRVKIVLDVWHPDLLNFITEEYSYITKAIYINKDFIRAVDNDSSWNLYFPDINHENYSNWNGDIYDWYSKGLPVQNYRELPARKIIELAHQNGVELITDLPDNLINPDDSRISIAKSLGLFWESINKSSKTIFVRLSKIRPKNSSVKGLSSRSAGSHAWGRFFNLGYKVYSNGFGPIGVGEIMSLGCSIIEQTGSRKGALMLILNDRHADILKFITCKQKPGVIQAANLSVGITEEFMKAKEKNEKWYIGYPPLEQMENFNGDFNKWEENRGAFETYEVIPAEDIWNQIILSAWKSAEPGVVFLERYNLMSNSYYYNPIIATNPCGEQGLPAYGVCNLGAIVLPKFVVGFKDSNAKTEFKNKKLENQIRNELGKHFCVEKTDFLLYHIKWEELEKTVRTGIRFQDAVIDVTHYPFEENKINQLSERRIGLGIMGLHDMLIYCGMRYGSEESIHFIDVLMGMIAEWCYLESVELAKEKRCFPKLDIEKYLGSGYMKMLQREKPHIIEEIKAYGIRNVTTMTIAPTGTIGTMLGCATGCEPYYAWVYSRSSRMGRFEEKARIVKEYFDTHSYEATLPDYFVTAMDLTPEEHVRVQAILQKWIDSSISKTCNVPADYSVENTKQLYELAYKLGCKGITIYRDQSRLEQVLEIESDYNKKENHSNSAILYGATYQKNTPIGSATLIINEDITKSKIKEIHIKIGKPGTEAFAVGDALSRVISLYLSENNDPDKEEKLINSLLDIKGHTSIGFGENKVTSIADAIAKTILEHIKTFPFRKTVSNTIAITGQYRDFCPNCQNFHFIKTGGCSICEACGYSLCE